MSEARREDYWGQFSAASRLPKHNRADPQNDTSRASLGGIDFTHGAATSRLATKPGLTLREEAVTGDGDDRRARSWEVVTREWRDWLREAQETSAVFHACDPDTNDEKEVTVPLENRFMEARQRRLYAKLHDVARGAREQYGALLTPVMLTFTASNRSGAGDWWRCPGNQLDDLLGSWSAVRRALSRVLDGRRFEYVRILEPHQSGYPHVHLAVFVEGPVSASTFGPVMEAHVENCLPASPEAHTLDGEAVSVREAGESGVENVAAYLAAYLMEWGEEALDAPENVQRFNALLWATGRRRWSMSSGAQEWAQFDGEKAGDGLSWDMTHIEVRDERYPVENGGGEVVRLDLPDSGGGLDPPPDKGVIRG